MKNFYFVLILLLLLGMPAGSLQADTPCAVDISSLDLGLFQRISVNESVTITADAVSTCEGDIYYRFDLIPGYNTENYDANNVYTTIQDFSLENSVTHTFTSPGNYIIVAFASATQGFPVGAYPIIGGSIIVLPQESDMAPAIQVAQDVSHLISSTEAVYSTQEADAITGNVGYAESLACPDVTLTGAGLNLTLTLTYSSGCELDGIPVEGTAIGSLSYQTGQGINISLVFSDFTVDQSSVDGNVNINANTIQGAEITLNSALAYTDISGDTQSLSITNMAVSVDTGNTLQYPNDDTYILNGTGTYTDSSDTSYTVTFTNVVSTFDCYVPVSGIASITSSDGTYNATIDFGDDTCDTVVIITTNNVTIPIDLSAL